MKFPITTNGQTTVNELIAALLDFPPNARVVVWGDNMENARLDVELPDGDVVVMEA